MREMKDSGIEWIGTIPFDWKCCKQKYEIQLINTFPQDTGLFRLMDTNPNSSKQKAPIKSL